MRAAEPPSGTFATRKFSMMSKQRPSPEKSNVDNLKLEEIEKKLALIEAQK